VSEQPQPSTKGTAPGDGSPGVQIPQPQSALPGQPTANAQLTEVERELSSFERSTLRWTRATTGIVLATGIFIGLQWNEMKSGSVDTGHLVEAAKKQAAANVLQVSNFAALAMAAKGQAENTATLADRMKEQAAQTKAIAEQAVIQAKAAQSLANAAKESAVTAARSLSNTIQSFQDDQRAWLGLAEIRNTIDSKAPFQLNIMFTNSGKTPAIQTEKAISWKITTTLPAGPPSDATYSFETATSVAPQGKTFTLVTNTIVPLHYPDIMAKKEFLSFYGAFHYHDIYRPEIIRTTKFCMVFNADSKDMNFCFTGNDMN
jgi:hypothetical protein